MVKFTSNEIRKMWLDFFKNKNHYELPSASLIPINDPSLLWINSGVATLKQYFDGRKTPPASRLTNFQKSIRTNDINNVGYTACHHTLFEMLGNFSIGDYFKKEAIIYAWEFLTSKKWIGINPNKLYVTVFNNDKETYDIWHNIIGLNYERIIKGNKNTNFWEIGKGPCGPNTEIFYDRGKKYDPEHIGIKLLQKNLKNNRYLEIWNIVFSQYNNDGDGTYTDLPQKNIDTGVGLERIASIIQKTPTNFETDLFMPIINELEKLVIKKYFYDQTAFFTKNKCQNKINIAFKVIADHLRAVVFAIADGVFPGNKDRNYIVRRLIRRSVLYGKKMELKQPFLYKLVKVVISIMSEYYNYLIEKQQIIEKTIFNEEKKFLKTLKQGSKLFNEIRVKYGIISKENAFNLFESYGFPIELIEEEAKNYGIKVDRVGFEELLENSKIISRINRKSIKTINLQNNFFTQLNVDSKFIGYKYEQINNSKIVFISSENKVVSELTNTTGYIILSKTPFYAEKGGQVSDKGFIVKNNNIAYILDVQQGPNNLHLHHVKIEGTFKKNDLVNAYVNKNYRFYISKNHSGTHLINYALRKVLGLHIIQVGSYIDDKQLRIDINHNKLITNDEINLIELSVKNVINAAIPCKIINTNIQTAIKKYKVLSFFDEKYDKKVRIVKFGIFSQELCGGIHVKNSKDIEDLLITKIESKGFGKFRIYAITSNKTIVNFLNKQFVKEKNEIINYFNKYNQEKTILVNKKIENIWSKINNLIVSKENWKLLKELIIYLKNEFKYWEKKYNNIIAQNFVKKYYSLPLQENNGIKILTYQFLTKVNINNLKILIDDYKSRYSNILIFFVDMFNSKKQKLIIAVSNALHDRYQANKIINKLNLLIDGKGGGNNSIAQSCFKDKTIIVKLLSNPFLFL